jgi:hypothetical protein
MKQLMYLAALALLVMGCEIKVEVPIKHVGVVITNEGEVKDEVLTPGKQIVRTDSEVILYDVSYDQIEDDVDFLFKDFSRGDLKLTVEFTPIVDSLPSFYRKYQSHRIPPVIIVKSRSPVRNLLKNYGPAEFSKDQFRTKIVEAITNNREITNYVKVHKVDVLNMRW